MTCPLYTLALGTNRDSQFPSAALFLWEPGLLAQWGARSRTYANGNPHGTKGLATYMIQAYHIQ